MHYLYERTGPEFIKPLVQTEVKGVEALKNVLHQKFSIEFGDLFRQWGQSLFAGKSDPDVYQYSHKSRNALKFPMPINPNPYPVAGRMATGSWIHQPLFFPLTAEIELQTEYSLPNIEWSSIVSGPAGDETYTENLSWPFVTANGLQHSTIGLLATHEGYGDDHSTVTFKADGTLAGESVMLAHGNGLPQSFSGNASFLLLDEEFEIGALYNAKNAGWVRSIRFKSIFLNELQGSQIPQSTPRMVLVDLYRVDENSRTVKLIPTIHHTVNRPFGNLSYETIALDDHYDILSEYSGKLLITLRSDHECENKTAVGMNYSGTDSTLMRTGPEESWSSIGEYPVQNGSLAGWNAILEIEFIQQASDNYSRLPLYFSAEADTEKMVLKIESPAAI